ncbi:redoxin domain-containing protein [Pinibacter aurantiacus]|uniref:Redoxin domain-containing protein n=1 Tax=Pinibacter aurantiacus TaxID=2851599 RepID=A0A9E2W282_9BACT|nr:redoxin domain-containing protein [Pinibacter aurantiacus]MBV4357030.1 redoxin domain-containing protein [Pinibacter aurantiacus]
MALPKGTKAPNFTLYDSEKKQVSLHDFHGKNVLLLFFPFAFSSVCTKELCSIRDDIGNYGSLNAQVLGISVDSLYSLDKFRKEQQLNFPLLSDFNKEVSKAFDVLYDVFPAFEMKGVSKRAAFVINKDGVIVYSEAKEVPSELPDFESIKSALQAAS